MTNAQKQWIASVISSIVEENERIYDRIERLKVEGKPENDVKIERNEHRLSMGFAKLEGIDTVLFALGLYRQYHNEGETDEDFREWYTIEKRG